jgi:hypothetical protein
MKTLSVLKINQSKLLKDEELLMIRGGWCAVYDGEYYLGDLPHSDQEACTNYIRQFYPDAYCANCY